MARTHKLNDLQLILLSTASQRESGCLLPYPDQLTAAEASIRKAAEALLKCGLVQETATRDAKLLWRAEDDEVLTLTITEAGLQAIGAGDGLLEAAEAPSPASKLDRETKASIVLGLLQRSEGATLPELIDATAWLPHTTRAALTGLRKKGHSIERTKRSDVTCYRIMETR
jgi:hypothetical protein